MYFESNYKGIRVIHVPLKKFSITFARILSFFYWHIFSLIISLFIRKIDVVFSPSPPLTIGFISILISKIKGAKFIYNVQEIYPDYLIKQGKLNSKFFISILQWLEKFVYNNSDLVITIDKHFYNQIIGKFENKYKLQIIPNFVDTEIYKPLKDYEKLPEMFVSDKSRIKVLYAGNIGFYQDWDPIIYAAEKLKNSNIDFWIIGEGVKRENLQVLVNQLELKNVKILPYQPRSLMPFVNAFADIHFISVSKEIEEFGFPSKVYTIMACSKPLIVVTGQNTPLHNFLYGLNCSILITENRNENFVNAVIELANNENKRNLLGQNGFNEILNSYTKERIVEKYVNIFDRL